MAKANMTVNVTWEMEVERLPKDATDLKQTAIIIAYNSVCNEIVQVFCDKQDMEFDGWVGGTVGGFADCGGFNYPTYTKVMSIKTTT